MRRVLVAFLPIALPLATVSCADCAGAVMSGDPKGLVSQGSYVCHAAGTGREIAAGENFSVTGAGTYADVAGESGKYRYDGSTHVITFRGASLDGRRARYDDRQTAKVTFFNEQDELADSCERR